MNSSTHPTRILKKLRSVKLSPDAIIGGFITLELAWLASESAAKNASKESLQAMGI